MKFIFSLAIVGLGTNGVTADGCNQLVFEQMTWTDSSQNEYTVANLSMIWETIGDCSEQHSNVTEGILNCIQDFSSCFDTFASAVANTSPQGACGSCVTQVLAYPNSSVNSQITDSVTQCFLRCSNGICGGCQSTPIDGTSLNEYLSTSCSIVDPLSDSGATTTASSGSYAYQWLGALMLFTLSLAL
jgi:hypothetical protein